MNERLGLSPHSNSRPLYIIINIQYLISSQLPLPRKKTSTLGPLRRRAPPQVTDLHDARDGGEGADAELGDEPLLEAPVEGERGPGEVADDGLAPGAAPLLLLALDEGDGLAAGELVGAGAAGAARGLVEEADELEADEGAPEARAPAPGLGLGGRGPLEDALGGQVGAVLEGLEDDAGGELRPREARLELAAVVAARLLRLLLSTFEHETARPEVHAQQAPEAQEGAGLAGQGAQGLEALGEGEDEGDAGGGQVPGGEEEGGGGREGAGEGDEAGGAALEGGLDEAREDGRGQARRVADEEEDGVDAGGGREAALQVGQEGVDVGRRRGEELAQGERPGRRRRHGRCRGRDRVAGWEVRSRGELRGRHSRALFCSIYLSVFLSLV